MTPDLETSTPNGRWSGPRTRAKRAFVAGAAALAFVVAVASNVEQLGTIAGRYIPYFAKTPLLRVDADPSKLARPLDGFGVREAEDKKPVYLEGLQLRIPIRHDRTSAKTIIVHKILFHIDSFTPGKDPRFSYRTQVDDMRGAGPAKPNVFRVGIAGTAITGASWILEDGTTAKQLAPSSNILDIDPPTYFEFQDSNGADAELLLGYVLPSTPGRYTIRMSIPYAAGDRSARTIEIGPFDIYHE